MLPSKHEKPMSDQKLKKVGARERSAIALTTSTNRRMRANYEAELQRRAGPGACAHCHAESCGALWTKPGDPEPGGDRCCAKCTHTPAPGWRHTHTAWCEGHHYPVCAVVMRAGDVVYFRRDGLIEFVELAPPKTSELTGALEPSIAFHGRPADAARLYFAGQGGLDAVNLWKERAALDEFWIPMRASEALDRDGSREQIVSQRTAEQDAELERLEAEHQAREAARRQADIEQKALEHETVTVLREMVTAENAAEAALAASGAGPPSVAELLPGESPVLGRKKRTDRQKVLERRRQRAEAMVEARRRLEARRQERRERGSA